MSDKEWIEYKDDISSKGRYENRACTIAKMQHNLGAYYVLEIAENKNTIYIYMQSV